MTGAYGLPLDVQFCRLCTMSNQRMQSTVERSAKPGDAKPTIGFVDGVCVACIYNVRKQTLDWDARDQEFRAVCDAARSKSGLHDVIVSGSGGKDSIFAAHLLKTKYSMHPLTCSTAPIIWTDIGRKNFDAWTRIADNVLFTPDGEQLRRDVRRDFLEYLHPFRSFVIQQRAVAPRLSKMTGIDLVFYGENPAERNGPIEENDSPLMDPKFYPDAGLHTRVLFLGYFVKWSSQQNYYAAVEACGFQGNDQRTQGSYSKMSSLDDAVDPWHYFCTLAKTGLGRASYNSAEDIRDGFITRDEGVALVKKYDQEFPNRYHQQCLDFIVLTADEFTNRVDDGRSPHIWERTPDGWTLKHDLA